MKTDRSDGGPAFAARARNATDMDIQYGMSLRDWFAGQALAGISKGDLRLSSGAEASWAYGRADAMIAERNRQE